MHALHEIWRALASDGILIDLRPVSDQWPIEVVSARNTQITGHVVDLPSSDADDEAANQGITQAAEKGWFSKEEEEFFPYYYSWDSPDEMEDYIEEEWEDYIGLDEATIQATSSVWALSDADARVRVCTKMLITCWRKQAG